MDEERTETPRGPGRPTEYDPDLAKEILERLADGETLSSICQDERFPASRTVRRWALDPDHEFSPLYTHARKIGYHYMADELLDISDDSRNDWMERHGKDDAGWTTNGDHVQRSRLRVDTRKWLLSKALPKVYGEKFVAEHSGPEGKPIEVTETSQWLARVLSQTSNRTDAAPDDSGAE